MSPQAALPRLRVAFAGAFAGRFADRVQALLDMPCDVTLADEARIIAELPSVDVLITMTFTAEMGAASRRLKLVQVPGAGLDRIDRSAIPAGVSLANAYGHEVGIAEYVIGAMVAFTRRFARLEAGLRRGHWESQWAVSGPSPLWPELAGKTLGILGYGRIGQHVARRAQAFDMTVWAIRRDVKRTDDGGLAFLGGPDALEKLMRNADYLAITVALTDATRGLIGERELGGMKPTAVLINVARAEIVDEAALYHALAQEKIAGAVLDVWYQYPKAPGPTFPSRYAFHELPSVLMTPHASGWTEGMLEERANVIAENIRRIARGESPVNLIAPAE